MLKRRFLSVLGAVILGAIAAPANADLFSFTLNNTHADWNGTTLTTTPSTSIAVGAVTRVETPTGAAVFVWPLDSSGSFLMTMGISGSGDSRTGDGEFTFTDIDGDTIVGDVVGEWLRDGTANSFHGVLTGVQYTGDDGWFNGHLGSAAKMDFPAAPWIGSLVELTGTAPWFDSASFSVDYGSVGANVIGPGGVVPVPAAALLGFLGLGIAGLKLREYA
jgi:hypothetical protein